MKLKNFVMVKFSKDTMVDPKESEVHTCRNLCYLSAVYRVSSKKWFFHRKTCTIKEWLETCCEACFWIILLWDVGGGSAIQLLHVRRWVGGVFFFLRWLVDISFILIFAFSGLDSTNLDKQRSCTPSKTVHSTQRQVQKSNSPGITHNYMGLVEN